MLSIWEAIERGHKVSKQKEASALYLRQLFDHFLWTLAKSAKNDVAAGTFKNPLKLTSVQEPHMLNAIRNKAQGKPYSEGAWVLSEDEGDVKPRTKRRKQRRDPQTAEMPGGSRKGGSEGDPSDDDSDHRPRTRSFKKIKREEDDAAESSLTLQRTSSSDITQEMDTDDPTVATTYDHSANPEGQPPDDNAIDTDSTLSNVPSSSGDEEPSHDSTTPGQLDATTRVSEQPSRSKKVQFVTMFDEAVPILQAILDDMPISPEDLEGHPNYDEKQAALVHWGQRKSQAVRLLGAMQKAYLSVMVPAEPEVEAEPHAAQETCSTQNETDREQTLANDPLPSRVPHASDTPPDAAPSAEK
ncbi:hypothetical protein FRC00_013200, partial [Tulasnella sp. 408]